ncbi:MAG: NAD(P)-dependent alcohol dehydrogenase [candidate division KSB1 bacterium]|jgi:NADPH:quinone reductase-like Zn-dependent oxidoreductase|nr:NAD(P)-dependent alcohol dehydrogenase [candidate division KSB1 bacterium]
MKAFVIDSYGQIDDIEQIELDMPQVNENDVLIRVKSAAINPADLKVISGKNGGKFIHSGKSPIGLGFDFSGVVEKTGPAVTSIVKDDEVYGFLPYSTKTTQGSFAEYVSVKINTIAKKPSSVSHTEAATVPTAAVTAYQALVSIGNMRIGHRILVNGASGGVGTYAVQIAKYNSAEVWGTCSAGRMDYVASLGADKVVDYNATPLNALDEKFDIVFDVASRSSYRQCLNIMNPGGVYITLLPAFTFFTDKIRSLFTSKKCKMVMVQPISSDLMQIAEMIDNKMMSTPVEAIYNIGELRDALAKYKEGVKGKIGIRIDA